MFNIQLNVQERQLFTFIILQFTLESTLQTIMNNKRLILAITYTRENITTMGFPIITSIPYSFWITLVSESKYLMPKVMIRQFIGFIIYSNNLTRIERNILNIVKFIWILWYCSKIMLSNKRNGLPNVIYMTALFYFFIYFHCRFFVNILNFLLITKVSR